MASDAALSSPDAFGAERRARALAVDDELSAIFGAAQPAADVRATAARGVAGRRRPPSDGASRFSAASLGAIGAAALAGIAAGVLMVRAPGKPAPSAPTHPAALPVQLVPPAETPQAADAELAGPSISLPTIAKPPQPSAAPWSHAPRPATVRRDVASADRRLRAAYAAAIRAGVARSTLAQERDRWASARRRNAGEPERLVIAYRDIAGDLNREAAHAHKRGAGSERRFRFHPRFPAWWR